MRLYLHYGKFPLSHNTRFFFHPLWFILSNTCVLIYLFSALMCCAYCSVCSLLEWQNYPHYSLNTSVSVYEYICVCVTLICCVPTHLFSTIMCCVYCSVCSLLGWQNRTHYSLNTDLSIYEFICVCWLTTRAGCPILKMMVTTIIPS